MFVVLLLKGRLSDWAMYGRHICEFLGFSREIPKLGILISTPRQFGKTESMVMIATALVSCVPGFKIISVSTGQRISAYFAERVFE